MAIRLVPLAMAAGKSQERSIKASVIKEPPPARVLIIPAKKPTTTNRMQLRFHNRSVILCYKTTHLWWFYRRFMEMKAYKALLKLLFSEGNFFCKKNKKNVDGIIKGVYICIRIQGIPDEALRRIGRVVECGSLENC